jgi:hypothetical protein
VIGHGYLVLLGPGGEQSERVPGHVHVETRPERRTLSFLPDTGDRAVDLPAHGPVTEAALFLDGEQAIRLPMTATVGQVAHFDFTSTEEQGWR